MHNVPGERKGPMLRLLARQLYWINFGVDALVAAALALALTADVGGAPSVSLALVSAAVWPISLRAHGLYRSQRTVGLAAVVGGFARACLIATVSLVATASLFQPPVDLALPLVCGVAQLVVLAGLRIAVQLGLRCFRRTGRNYRNVLIVGSGPRARDMRDEILGHPEWGARLIGFIDEADKPVDPALSGETIRNVADFPRILEEEVVDEVIVACPRSRLDSILPIVATCAEIGLRLTLPTDLFGGFPPPRVTSFGARSALSFAPVHHGRFRLGVKRAIDVAGALGLLLLTAPLLASLSLLIRATSPGPAFFRQVRCGLNGRRFEMLKLRTMCVNAEEQQAELLERNEMDGPVFKVHDDPRLTRIGHFLRRWSLDEVPQLWNVLWGDMSLVGPRPAIPDEVARYEVSTRRRLSMRPGLTCIWQVSGRNLLCFEEWVKLDVEYIDNWSLTLDLKLLLRTLPAVLGGRGAS